MPFFLFLILAITTASLARAATLPLDRVGAYTLLHNPQLTAARLRIDEARGRVVGAGRLTNPELELEYLQNVRAAEGALSIALMQRFPLTGRLRLEKSVSRAQLAAAEAEVRDVERRLVAAARTEAVRLVSLGAQRHLRMQQLENSRQQASFIKKRYETGEAAAVDVAQLDLEVRQLEIDLLQLASARATLVGSLRTLLGVPAADSLEITGTLSTPVSTPPRGGSGSNRPDLEAARHNAEAARHSLSLARARTWQDIGVGLVGSGERMEDAPDGVGDDFFLGLRFSLPLPVWDRNQGPILEAQAAAARAEKETAALAFSIETEMEAARSEMAALASVIAEMNAVLLPKASEVETQFRTAFSAGQTPLTEVLRARARRLELEQRRVDALRDYHLARVRYEAAQGHRAPTGQSGK